MKRSCKQCARTIRADSGRAVFLYLEPGGREAWLCGRPRCLTAYNDDEAGERESK